MFPCREAIVFSGSGWTVVKVQAALADSLGKVKEGIMFFSRGIRLLGSDLSSAGRLFSRAVLGGSLLFCPSNPSCNAAFRDFGLLAKA